MSDKPNWPEGYFSAEWLKQLYSNIKNNALRNITIIQKDGVVTPIGDEIIKDAAFINYLYSRIYTFEVNLKTLVGFAKDKCLKQYPKEQAKCDQVADLIIDKVRDPKEPLNGRKQVSCLFYKDNTGIAGTPPYKKPGFIGSKRLKDNADPSDMNGDPNWLDGYFSVAYLQKLYDGLLTQSDPENDTNKKIIDPSLKYGDVDINFGLDEDNDKTLTELSVLQNLRDGINKVNNCTVHDVIEMVNKDDPCRKYSEMKQYDKKDKCTKVPNELLNLKNGYIEPLMGDVDKITAENFPELPGYNTTNPTPAKKKWFGGKRKQRRNKTNKLRTRTNNKRTKHSRKVKRTTNKNKRAKHSRKAKKARKSRNARKTRKH